MWRSLSRYKIKIIFFLNHESGSGWFVNKETKNNQRGFAKKEKNKQRKFAKKFKGRIFTDVEPT